jgi:GNAT superfamily N-acetyltransferase
MNHSEISYSSDQISVADYEALLVDAGWNVPGEDAIIDSLANTVFSTAARDINGDLLGYGRVLGDKSLHHYVSDVIVFRRFRKQGIGSRIMGQIMDHIRHHARPGAFVGVFSTRGQELFFARQGFIQRPNAQNGAGMFVIISGR